MCQQAAHDYVMYDNHKSVRPQQRAHFKFEEVKSFSMFLQRPPRFST